MRVMVVDGSVIIYKQFNKVGHLKTSTGIPTGLRYGFIRAINSYKKKLKCDRVIITWDTNAPVKKAQDAEFIESYKSNRDWSEAKETMYSQVQDLKEMIKLTAWNQVEEDGYEADDLIGAISRRMVQTGNEVVVVSTDNDLCQLINEKVAVYAPGKEPELKNPDWVMRKFGVPPELLLYYRAAAGDTSDTIPGIGWPALTLEVYAAKLNTWFEQLLQKEPECGWEQIARQSCATVDSQFDLRESHWNKNLKLMKLIKPESVVLVKGIADQNELRELFLKLEFRSLMATIPDYCS